jgi:uncharacterized protein DUF397
MNSSTDAATDAAAGPSGKPSVTELGIDLDAPTSPPAPAWRRSGTGTGAIEVAFVEARGDTWVLMRVAGDPTGRVLVYDRHEWECFIDGAKKGEFDHAAGLAGTA